MRKMLIVLALVGLTLSSTGCTRCRNLFRRGSPCGGTALAAPAMLGGAIPLGNPVALQQAPPQVVPQHIIAQPGVCCENAAPICCDPCPPSCCPSDCGPSGYMSGAVYGGDCGCEGSTGQYFGGQYLEGSAPPTEGTIIEGGTYQQGSVIPGGTTNPQGSSTYPEPRE